MGLSEKNSAIVIAALREDNDKKDAEIAELKEGLAALNEFLNIEKENTADAKEDLAAAKAEIQRLKSDNAQASAQAAIKQAEIDKQAYLAQCKTELKKRLAELEEKTADVERKRVANAAEVEALRAKLGEKNKLILALQVHVNDLIIRRIEALRKKGDEKSLRSAARMERKMRHDFQHLQTAAEQALAEEL